LLNIVTGRPDFCQQDVWTTMATLTKNNAGLVTEENLRAILGTGPTDVDSFFRLICSFVPVRRDVFSRANFDLVRGLLMATEPAARRWAVRTVPYFVEACNDHAADGLLGEVLSNVDDCPTHVLNTIPYFLRASYSFAADSSIREVVWGKLDDGDPTVAEAALQTLRHLVRANPRYADEEHMQRVVPMLKHHAATVRGAAVRTLDTFAQANEFLRTSAVHAVLPLSAEEHYSPRDAAVELIQRYSTGANWEAEDVAWACGTFQSTPEGYQRDRLFQVLQAVVRPQPTVAP